MFEKLIAALVKAGILKEEQTSAVKDALKDIDLSPQAPVIDASKLTDTQLKDLIASLNTQITALNQSNKNLSDALAAEKTQRENVLKAQQDADKSAKESKAKELIDTAKKNGKITEAETQKYIDKAIADYDGTKVDIEKFATIPGFKPENNGKAGGGNDRKINASLLGPLAGADPIKVAAMKKMDEMANEN